MTRGRPVHAPEWALLEPHGWTLVNEIDAVLETLPARIAGRASAETHACAIELATRPHPEVRATAADLAALRRMLDRTLEGLDMRAAVAGTHPSAVWSDVEPSSGARYRRIHASMRALARPEPTFALHVHVAVPDGETAVRALGGLRRDLPLLLALSANSPYWQGRDTGLASARTPLFSMFPRTGIPRRFDSYAAYVRAVDTLIRAGAVPDASFLWWDARLQPRLATVEVRIMDGQTGVAEAAALTAVVQCLVRLHAEGARRPGPLTPETLAENRFLAARDGIGAWLVEGKQPRMRPAVELVAELLDECRPVAATLGCRRELEAVATLAANPGHARQRATPQVSELAELTADLAAEFAPAEPATAAAGVPSVRGSPPRPRLRRGSSSGA